MHTRKVNKIALILRKEWLELRQQRVLIITTIIPPLLFIILPILIAYVAGHTSPKGLDGRVNQIGNIIPAFQGLNIYELGQAVIGQQFGVLLLLLPTIIPSIIASYSIVGEKTSRTLEPLLATPVSTTELLVAKTLTAVIPAVAVTWFVALVYIVGMRMVAVSDRVFNIIVSPGWLIILLLGGPLLALLVVAATVAVSSKANDPRTAQQISAVVIVPVMGLFAGQVSGVIALSPLVSFIAVAILAALCVLAMFIVVKLFQRETILTKWT
ncbi:MAG: ABC transporter permease subunit [Chloroflexota bacterium]|nr:ABC transporter permease subunit [Chloroflexota bacterium]